MIEKVSCFKNTSICEKADTKQPEKKECEFTSIHRAKSAPEETSCGDELVLCDKNKHSEHLHKHNHNPKHSECSESKEKHNEPTKESSKTNHGKGLGVGQIPPGIQKKIDSGKVPQSLIDKFKQIAEALKPVVKDETPVTPIPAPVVEPPIVKDETPATPVPAPVVEPPIVKDETPVTPIPAPVVEPPIARPPLTFDASAVSFLNGLNVSFIYYNPFVPITTLGGNSELIPEMLFVY